MSKHQSVPWSTVEARELVGRERPADAPAQLVHELLGDPLERGTILRVGLREAALALAPQPDASSNRSTGTAASSPPAGAGVQRQRPGSPVTSYGCSPGRTIPSERASVRIVAGSLSELLLGAQARVRARQLLHDRALLVGLRAHREVGDRPLHVQTGDHAQHHEQADPADAVPAHPTPESPARDPWSRLSTAVSRCGWAGAVARWRYGLKASATAFVRRALDPSSCT